MYAAILGDNGMWGVEENDVVLYEPSFARQTAEAIADMENSERPPKDWMETADKLTAMGLSH